MDLHGEESGLESQVNSYSRRAKRVNWKWRERSQPSWSFFCPLCRDNRKVSIQARMTFRHVAQLGLTSIVFSLATWNWLGWRGLISFVPFWTLFEIVYRIKRRAALYCPNCGFDPYLYLTDPQRAREEIENHWRKKFAEKGVPFPEKDRSSAGGRKTQEDPPTQAASQPQEPDLQSGSRPE